MGVEHCDGSENFLPDFQTNMQFATVLWLLAEDMTHLYQRQRPVYYSQQQQQPECQHFVMLTLHTQIPTGNMMRPGDTCTRVDCVQEINPKPRQRSSFIMGCEQTCPAFVLQGDTIPKQPRLLLSLCQGFFTINILQKIVEDKWLSRHPETQLFLNMGDHPFKEFPKVCVVMDP